MFRIGDAVIHPAEGVCEITEITKKDFGGKTEEYYVLKTVYDSRSTVYIPVVTASENRKIRLALKKEEVDDIIGILPDSKSIVSENDNQRRILFKQHLNSGDVSAIGQVLKTVYELKASALKSGRKMKVSDERIIKETEHALFYEFAYCLGVRPEEVENYIKNMLSEN